MCIFQKKKKVGLVLGSGGARGLTHIGVIKALVKNKIPIDLVVGSSAGALVGGLFALQGGISQLEEIIKEFTYKDLIEVLVDPTWKGGLIKGQKTLEYLKRIYGDNKIEELSIRFAAVATDLYSAETVVFSKGSLADAVRASISVPLIYSPIALGGSVLVDGGVSDPVPVEVAKEMGADIIIAVNLDGVYFSKENRKRGAGNSTLDILKDSYFALRYNLAKKEAREASVIIEPVMPYVTDFDFVKGKELIEIGEKTTEKLMPKIKKLI